ncbi:unnamed protein product [Ceratitis capitata]|uniref:(Mediterranean fruit fly) hypothetical protein n=1 Tax=Ceratitis capitata TaxID=7213 RepID=A0A811VEN8_CERCA|nr:unnamed protein product [Ceratitis capitata]
MRNSSSTTKQHIDEKKVNKSRGMEITKNSHSTRKRCAHQSTIKAININRIIWQNHRPVAAISQQTVVNNYNKHNNNSSNNGNFKKTDRLNKKVCVQFTRPPRTPSIQPFRRTNTLRDRLSQADFEIE